MSVVVPVLKGDLKYFQRALRYWSVESPGFPWELIVVTNETVKGEDGGALPDNMLVVPTVRYSYAAAFNHGSQIASGEVVVCALPYVYPEYGMLGALNRELRKYRGSLTKVTVIEADDPRGAAAPRLVTWSGYEAFGIDMELWRWIGGFDEQAQKPAALSFENLDKRLRIANIPAGTLSDKVVFRLKEIDTRGCAVSYPTVRAMRDAGGIYTHPVRKRVSLDVLTELGPDDRAPYEMIRERLRGKSVLEVPCGTGYGADIITSAVSRYIGIDADHESVTWATDHHKSPKTLFASGSVEQMQDESFEAVISFQLNQWRPYFASYVEMLHRVQRLLKPGGVVYFTTGETPRNVDGYVVSSTSCCGVRNLVEMRKV